MTHFPPPVRRALDHLSRSEVSTAVQSTWLHRMLWSLGVAVPPPPFAGCMTNTFLSGVSFAVGWGGLMAAFNACVSGQVPAQLWWGAGVGGALYGGLRAGQAWRCAKRYALPPWRAFKSQGTCEG